MTYTKLFGYGLFLVAVLVFLKIVFFSFFTWGDTTSLHFFYWGCIAVLVAALVRRLGVITLLEALVVTVLWILFAIIADVALSGPLAGWGVLADPDFAIGYLVLIFAVMAFHKKRHVHRRQLMVKK